MRRHKLLHRFQRAREGRHIDVLDDSVLDQEVAPRSDETLVSLEDALRHVVFMVRVFDDHALRPFAQLIDALHDALV